MATRSSALGRATTRRRTDSSTPAAALRPGHPGVLLSIVVAALVLLGLVMILSASSVSSFATYGSSFLFFKRQLIWAAIGLVVFVFFVRTDYRRLRGWGYVGYALAAGLLLVVLIPGVGVSAGGSARWLSAGPLSFQPSEVAKLALVLFAADVFSRKREERFDSLAHTAVPLLPALAVIATLVMLQPDLGTTLMLGAIGLGLLFVAGAPMRYMIPIYAAGAALASAAAFAEPYRRARVLAFLNPWADPYNTGYQTIQSLVAMGSGGWFGVGLGASRQKWLYVPNAHTDFIYAILGEETGLLGSLVVLGLFLFLACLGVRTARRAPDRFGSVVAAGITIWIATQALTNMGAVTGVLPITGVPLPLVSFGGTSLVVSLAAMGVLINIAHRGELAAAGRGRPRRKRPAARKLSPPSDATVVRSPTAGRVPRPAEGHPTSARGGSRPRRR
ncbi:MAG: putative lipid II flippase FtsW [Actinomycetota bacterium]